MNKTEHYLHLGLCLPAIEHDQHWWIANAILAWHVHITIRKSNTLHLILVWGYRISCRMRLQNATRLFKILAWHKKNLHLLDRDCPHPHCPLHERARRYPSVLHLHLFFGHENLLRQLVIPCTYVVCTCTYVVYTCTYVVHGYYWLFAYTTSMYASLYSHVRCMCYAIVH